MADDVELASNALLLIGANPIVEFDDGTKEAEVATAFYERTLASVLTERRWSFNSKQLQLPKLLDVPLEGYAFAYQLPADMLALLKVYPEWIQYDLFENKMLYTDFDGDLFAEYQFKPDESNFPEYFSEYFEVCLALKFVMPITEDVGKFNSMLASKKEFGRLARLADSKQRKNVGIKRFPLTQVRGG